MTASSLPMQQLQAAIAEADLRVLLMVVFQLSGDRRWLAEPFRPKRDVNLIAANDAGFAAAEQAEIRAAAIELLSTPARQAAISSPDDRLTLEMMRWCLGENIAAEYAPMMREEMAFTDRHVRWSTAPSKALTTDTRPVIIVGAGASGIALAANLVKLAIPFIILEKNPQVGGTWFENTYPGCGVDTPNHAYSFSFGRRNNWSRYFAPQPEIHAYLTDSAADFGLLPHIRFRHQVTAAKSLKAAPWSVPSASSVCRRCRRSPVKIASTGRSFTAAGGPMTYRSPASAWRSSGPVPRPCKLSPPWLIKWLNCRFFNAAPNGPGRSHITTTRSAL